MKLAEALLLRKHLAQKVEQLKPIKLHGDGGIFEIKTQRKYVSDNIDEIVFQIPKVTMAEVTKTFDLYASELRKLDAAIQEANWQHTINYAKPEEIK